MKGYQAQKITFKLTANQKHYNFKLRLVARSKQVPALIFNISKIKVNILAKFLNKVVKFLLMKDFRNSYVSSIHLKLTILLLVNGIIKILIQANFLLKLISIKYLSKNDFPLNSITFFIGISEKRVNCFIIEMQNLQSKQFDLLFVRHAESQFNKATLDYVQRENIIYDWQHLSKDHKFLSQIKYSYQLLDATITEKGYRQCAQARQKFRNIKPDIILVSPLNRTLLTCSQIFPNPQCPVIVQPVLAEGIRSSCDFSSDLKTKQESYPTYNFDKVIAQGPFWFLKNDSEQNQEAYQKIIQQNKQKPYDDILREIFKVLLKTFMYQTATNLRRRTDRVKSLVKEYKKTNKLIVIVSHYNIIRFSLAKEFNENDEPYHCHIQNCQICPATIEKL